MDIVLTIIACQQGLFGVGWLLAGLRLGLSRRAALHWMVATWSAGLALTLILQRGHWPDWLTIVVANLLAMGSFIAVRRGVQVFLHLPASDRESALVLLLVLAVMTGFAFDSQLASAAVVTAALLMAWTLLRCAWEAARALRRSGDRAGALIVALPLALLGLVYLLRGVTGVLRPDLAAQPLNAQNTFNTGVVVSFMVMGLVLNLLLAYMVANRLVRRLHQRAVRDPLTGLLNRRGLMPQLLRQSVRLQRHREPYAVLVVDVDHFKAVNDEYGHAVGDQVLVRLGELLHQAAREIDTVARVGGEEFCLLLPHADLNGAEQVAERLRQRVREADWPPLQQAVTISVGVALASAADDSAQAVMERADQALLQAKHLGRDRVVLAAA